MSASLRSFAWHGEPGSRVALHLQGFHLDPVDVPETAPGRYAVELVLPDDATVGYGFVVDAPGAEPGTGWALHRVEPGAEPLAVIPHPWGATGVLAVSEGPGSRRHPAWRADAHAPADPPPVARRLVTASGRAVLLLGEPSPDAPLAVVFDGDVWAEPALGLTGAVSRWPGRGALRLALVSTPDREVLDRRATMRTILDEVLAATGERWSRVLVAGQSYGGLAAAGLLLDAPDLVDGAVLQSGSFWFDEQGDPRARPFDVPGTLVQRLRAGDFAGDGRRAVVQVGSEEGAMIERSRDFAEAATAAGFAVESELWRGGHDYAWYRHGLLAGIDRLLT